MFCDACGATLQTGQAYCGRCGKEIRGATPIAYPNPSRVRAHVRLLGILWIAHSAFHVIGGIVLMVLANTLFAQHQPFPGGPNFPPFLQPLLGAIAIFLLAKAAVGFAAGWGLLQRESWARVLTLVVAFLALFEVPIGTALGIYTLWVLLPSQSDQEYEEHVRAA
jgi:hypothetical protein